MTFMGFVKNYSGLLAARWFLGLAEAGLYLISRCPLILDFLGSNSICHAGIDVRSLDYDLLCSFRLLRFQDLSVASSPLRSGT